jgi:hypothetical protein
MKKPSSDNLSVRAGLILVEGFNAFPTAPLTEAGFRETIGKVRDAMVNGRSIQEEDWCFPSGKVSLGELSAPRFAQGESGKLRMTGGILLYGGVLLEPGAEVMFAGGGVSFGTSFAGGGVSPAVGLRAEWRRMQYDTYNATPLAELDPQIAVELDLDVDGMVGAVAVDEGDIVMVKYQSVYAPDLASVPDGVRAMVLNSRMEKYDDYDYDRDEYHSRTQDVAVYDRFLVEFTDRSQPFGYITVEVMPGTYDAAGYYDTFGEIFDGDAIDEYKLHDPDEILETLRRICESEL